jgi:hypothetical protein
VSTSGIEHGNVLTAGQISEVSAGRVTTLEHGGDNIASIRVIEGPQFGNLTVNPDNTLALVLSHSQQTGQISFSYEVSYGNGSQRCCRTRRVASRGLRLGRRHCAFC